ncbi:MAG TPA: ABC transporter permease [Mycobacteriales bacterium]|nr:ABC transporter permease [Mycobacteriales bacterium]
MITAPSRVRFDQWLHWADLTRVLAVKNFRQKYLRSRLGVLWALLQPLAQAAVLSFVFMKIFKVHKVPHYPIYVLSGIMAWSFFSQAVVGGTTAVVDNASLVRKVSVPKLTFPISVVGGVLLVFLLQTVVLLGGAVQAGTLSPVTPALLLLAVVLEALLGMALAILFCAFQVFLRDIRFVVESGLLMSFYLTPVLYDPSRLPAKYQHLLQWNPMYGVLSLLRAALLGRTVNWTSVAISAIVTMVLLIVAVPVFRHRSADFADVV